MTQNGEGEAMKIRDIIGKRIKAKRTEGGMTLRDLSKKAGLSFVTIGRAENGSVDIRVSTLLALSRAFKVSPLFFLD